MNVLQVLCDLLDLVQDMNTQIAAHVHASSPPPNNAAAFTIEAANTQQLAAQLKSITLQRS